MWPGLLLLLTLLAVLTLYLTNKHQRLRQLALPRAMRYPAYALLVLIFIGWLWQLTLSAAIFTWLISLMLALICVPFAGLLSGRK